MSTQNIKAIFRSNWTEGVVETGCFVTPEGYVVDVEQVEAQFDAQHLESEEVEIVATGEVWPVVYDHSSDDDETPLLEGFDSGDSSTVVLPESVDHIFNNHYKCPNCSASWESEGGGQPEDHCYSCETRHITPYKSDLLGYKAEITICEDEVKDLVSAFSKPGGLPIVEPGNCAYAKCLNLKDEGYQALIQFFSAEKGIMCHTSTLKRGDDGMYTVVATDNVDLSDWRRFPDHFGLNTDDEDIYIDINFNVEPSKAKQIDLGVYDIEVDLTSDGGGSISSDLKEGHTEFDAAIDGIESMILAHAVAGIDVTDPAYLEGVETAVQAAANAYDDEEQPIVIIRKNDFDRSFGDVFSTVDNLKVVEVEGNISDKPTAIINGDEVVHWSAKAELNLDQVNKYLQAFDKGMTGSEGLEGADTDDEAHVVGRVFVSSIDLTMHQAPSESTDSVVISVTKGKEYDYYYRNNGGFGFILDDKSKQVYLRPRPGSSASDHYYHQGSPAYECHVGFTLVGSDKDSRTLAGSAKSPTGLCVANPHIKDDVKPVVIATDLNRDIVYKFVEEMCRQSWDGSDVEELLGSELESINGDQYFICYAESSDDPAAQIQEYIDVLGRLGVDVPQKASDVASKLFPSNEICLVCAHCNADLTEVYAVSREYINKDGGESVHSIGGYDAKGNFIPDAEACLSGGRYDLADNSDTCVMCETRV